MASPVLSFVSSFLEPLASLGVVLRHAMTIAVKRTEIVHGAPVSLLSGLLGPFTRLDVVLRHAIAVVVKHAEILLRIHIAAVRACLAHGENLVQGGSIHVTHCLENNCLSACKDLIHLFSLLFRYLSLLFGAPAEPYCDRGQHTHCHERNISNSRHRRSFALRVFSLTQGRLAFGLRRSHRLKLLALSARSRLSFLFTRADKVEV